MKNSDEEKNNDADATMNQRLKKLCDIIIKISIMDFSEKAEVGESGDEIDAIAAGINTLSEELMHAREEKKKYIDELKQANTRMKKTEEQLIKANTGLEEKVAERTREVIKSEKKFRSSLDTMLEGIQIISFDWRYAYVNDAVARQGKYPKEELMGHTMMEKYPGIENTELFSVLRYCMSERVSKHMENEFSYPDGSKDWFELNIQPVPQGILILSINITERKKAEEKIKKLNDELEQKVKERTSQLESVNKELEAFTYSVSHDLRAPLRAVNGYARMVEEDYSAVLNDEGKRLLYVIQDNARKMGALIDDLLAFSRLGKKGLQKTDLDMNKLAEGALLELNKSVHHHAKVKIGRLHPASGDYGLISQVMINLLSNGIKYSSKKKNSRVEINSEKKDNCTIYSVKDNGVGFDMQYAHKLFGVFQRLHKIEEFEGTGVGLAIVERIVKKHGGKVWAEAKLNKGAAFYFSLP